MGLVDKLGQVPITAVINVHEARTHLSRLPFDRLLAAQAALEDLTLVTRESAFADFPCHTMW